MSDGQAHLTLGLDDSHLPPVDSVGGLSLHSFLSPRDPNGEGLPLWPSYNKLGQYLEISPTPRVGHKLREARMHFWTETLPAKIQQWQQTQKGRKALGEL